MDRKDKKTKKKQQQTSTVFSLEPLGIIYGKKRKIDINIIALQKTEVNEKMKEQT